MLFKIKIFNSLFWIFSCYSKWILFNYKKFKEISEISSGESADN